MTNNFTGTRTETVKRSDLHFGRVTVYSKGRRLYSFSTGIPRSNRGEAFRDAQAASAELNESQADIDSAVNVLLNS